MTPREALEHPWQPGDLVHYSPSDGYPFGAVVASDVSVHPLHPQTRTVRLEALGEAYRQHTRKKTATVVTHASCYALRPLPTEYWEGEWSSYKAPHGPEGFVWAEQKAGRWVWRWWAEGYSVPQLADSYETARAAVESAARKAVSR